MASILYDMEIAIRSFMAAAAASKRQATRASGHVDIFLCIVDHYEPHCGQATRAQARRRHNDWLRSYPRIADAHRDCDGRKAVHTFFYPWDEFDPWEFDTLVDLCSAGAGEIELHLHHRDDTAQTLRALLGSAIDAFRQRGALSLWPDGQPAFGFIHGNWALDNSRHENGRNFCGVDNELDVLVDAGCYADFTFPAWRHSSQPRQVNSLYYARGRTGRGKSYDTGDPSAVGRSSRALELLLVQGPLAPSFVSTDRGRGLFMDDGDLASYRRYEPVRLNRWVRAGIQVTGRDDRLFIKLHCHGADDENRAALLGADLDALFDDANSRYNDGLRYRLHYVTAREMFNVVKATESGVEEIDQARDFVLPRPLSYVGAPA
jgi:hypothetical protein